ncbi:beta-ketoacyl reductase, partial [Amycolatopsis magusensis]|uniref:beta-ketoacyl reductase n=1 Tax=Amycolatopsis magusensis TaxID=882444 RepID=UPI0024A84E92
GVLDDGILDRLTPDRFQEVFQTKVDSALLLDELTRDKDLSAFVLFSSASSAIGNPGQANYAAANAVLDALAERRRADGHAATSIAWGAWGGGGMADTDHAMETARRAGVAMMEPELACQVLRQLAVESEPTAVVAAVDQSRFASGFRPSPLMRELAPAPGAVAEAAPAEPELAEQVLKLAPARRYEVVLELVRTRAAEVLGQADLDAVREDRPFRDLGFDSLAVVELRNRLNAATGLSLASTLVFDHPNPKALAEHLLEQLVPEGASAGTEEAEVRELLASVPLAKLREHGMLDQLLRLARPGGEPEENGEGASIDTMTVDDLVQAALSGQDNGHDDESEPSWK